MTITCLPLVATDTPVHFEIPAEPATLRNQLRSEAADDPAATAAESADRVARAIAESAAGELVCLGIGPEALRAAARSYKREIWLWVMGERRWAPTVESIVGRAARRAG